jgi:hypothetical protein
MSLYVVAAHSEIRKANKSIRQAFLDHGAKPVKRNVGWPGGNADMKVFWAEDIGLWYASALNPESRYWNAFGTHSPPGSSLSVSCEVNFPVRGINRSIGGVVVSDGRGNTLIAHRGKIGGGKKGISKTLFWQQYEGKLLSVWDGDQETQVAAVAEIGARRFLHQLRLFVEKVEQIKARAQQQTPGRPNLPSPATEAKFKIQSLGDEFYGTKSYALRQTVSAACDHGLVVKHLRQLLQQAGCRTGKDQYRDLYVHDGRKVTSLCEVKPGSDRQSIYAGIGQLLMYSLAHKPRPQLFLVVPVGVDPARKDSLRQLGIHALEFDWHHDKPVFPAIKNWKF